MLKIKLIVTGDLEKLALHQSLSKVFPKTLMMGKKSVEVVWDKPRKLDCTTSHRLSPLKIDGDGNRFGFSSNMRKLAQAMLDEALPGKKGKPADLVIVIDDVELGNLDRECLIAEHFRAAVEDTILKKQYDSNTESRCRKIIRERCSFAAEYVTYTVFWLKHFIIVI